MPLTEDDRRAMLARIGVREFEDLLAPLPDRVRLTQPHDLPPSLAQADLAAHLRELADSNAPAQGWISFCGGGIYDHFIPPALNHLAGRSEYYTAYTPYQPEVAQGTLRATFEFQSMICRLTGMDVANASLYDGAMAMVEAVFLAYGKTKRNRIVMAGSVNPRWRTVLNTFANPRGIEIVTLPARVETPTVQFDELQRSIDDQTAAIVVASPNYFGLIEDTPQIADIAHSRGAMMIECFSPVALGVVRTPGESGADLAIGEGQPLGNPPSYGGPLLGLFAARMEDVRRIPGRLVAKTVDREDTPAYVMALQTREQHIRREKATSNVCTAQALLATRAAIYLALLGETGFRQLAETCLHRAHSLADRIDSVSGFSVPFGRSFFNEFVVKTPVPAGEVVELLSRERIHPGIDLARFYPEFNHHLLMCVTEKHSPSVLERLIEALKSIAETKAGGVAPKEKVKTH